MSFFFLGVFSLSEIGDAIWELDFLGRTLFWIDKGKSLDFFPMLYKIGGSRDRSWLSYQLMQDE